MQAEISRTRGSSRGLRLLVDIVIFVGFLIAMSPRLFAAAPHEWLSIAVGGGVIVHLLLNWSWLVAVTQRLFTSVSWAGRANYVLNTLLFVDFTVIMFTGLLISRAALPELGIQLPRGGDWREVHTISSTIFPYLVGLHIALHWNWIVNSVKRRFGRYDAMAAALPKRNAPNVGGVQ